ncbi:dTDP-4-dehydrorhamnose 3,5-epimerase [Pedobacter sp. Bi27]|uniref:dTDP-4-dehydrorhamnose 3,5-epimerase n=1 Tax=unclassified Pedobacter TaxID=2628915 RepID=UPI001DA33B30|nr:MULTISPECIES: dTDP-4-dehydrorhamnose 3,5-epimerase [unclassified Pedobacter]CAH0198169.1 dTDP-4-dehydrorhamnose 3,5-epimerase [Pedobacter sp. Bi36]CAH0253749.1 dTDP-4-dehydrorhamnose 3,5-epimerase [Pedobacter sp. Bi126]CAH0308059.1 dTDP-4-dehydrorhamnose 3,5-epimerase [Pedobacter sp. Bi27]
MEIEQTGLKDCLIIKPRVFEDPRGYFFESFNQNTFEEKTGLSGRFVQDNESYSSYGVVRGLHAQTGEFAQAKLVRVTKGEVLDVAVDVRPSSPTYGKHFAIRLSAENKLQLYIPRGFIHGFSVLSETAEFLYKCDNFFNKASETGVIYNDADLNIDWLIPEKDLAVSDKDLLLKPFSALKHI